MNKILHRRSFLKTSLLTLSCIGFGGVFLRFFNQRSETAIDVAVCFDRTLSFSGQTQATMATSVVSDPSRFFHDMEPDLLAALGQHFGNYEKCGSASCVKQEIQGNRFFRMTRWKSMEEFNRYHEDPIIRNLTRDVQKLGYVFSHSIVKV